MFGNSFGQSQPAATNSFGFGQSAAAPAPAFGQPAASPFGAANSGAPATSSPFGQPASTAPATASPFGSTAAASPFGSNLNPGLNNAMSPLGTNPAGTGTTKVPWSVHEEKDKDPRLSTNKTERYFGITMMPQYSNNSFNELRLQDYENNVKGPTNTTGFGFGQAGATQPASSPFGQAANSLSTPFGQAPSTFGQPANATTPAFGAATSATNAFGSAAPATSAFGGSSTFGNNPATNPPGSTGFGFGANSGANSTGTGLFGQSANTATSSPFGAKPATSGFGQPAVPSTGFGFNGTGSTGTSAFGASAPPQNSLFGNSAGNNSATTTPFGQTKPSLFGATPNQPTTNTGTGLFGQPNPPTSSGLFGQNNANSNTNAAGTGLFGQSNPAANSAFGSTFGQPSQPAAATGAFGQTSAPSNAFGQPAASNTSGFGFGATQNKPATGLFGQPTTPTNNAFGQTNSGAVAGTGGLFGSKPATGAFGQPAAPSATSGFGFGNQTTNSANPAFGQKPAFGAANNNTAGTSSTGLFGSTNTNTNAGSGLFGNTNTNNNTGTGLFGNTSNNNQASTSTGFGASTGGLFGGANNTNNTNTAGNNSGSSLFGGATNNATNNQSNSGLFNKPAGGTGLFGQNNSATNNTGTGLFGQPNQNNGGALGQSSFGQINNNNGTGANNTQGGLFGNKPSTGLFGSTATGTNNNSTLGSGGLFGNNNNNNNNPSALGSQPPGAAGSSLFRGAAQGPSGPVASIDSNAYLDNPLFANIRPSNDSGDTSAPSAKPRQESSNFRAPSGVLLAQIMQPRPLPAGRRLAEPRSITGGAESKDQSSKQPKIISMPSNKVNGTKDSAKLNKFRNAIFSNHTDELILNTSAFDFAGRRTQQLITASGSDELSKSSDDSQVIPPKNREDFEILSPSNSPYDDDDEDYIAARQLNPDGSMVADHSVADASLNEPGNTSLTAAANSTTHAVSENPNEIFVDEAIDALNVDEDIPDNEIVDKNGYWISPSKRKLLNMTVRETRGVRNFRVGQRTHGFVEFLESVDLSKFSEVSAQVCGRLIVFSDRSFCLYPNESERPPVGQGFNVKHRVTLYNIFPHSRETQEPIKDGDHPIAKKFLKRLKAQPGFVSWSPQMGTWTFEVDPSKPSSK